MTQENIAQNKLELSRWINAGYGGELVPLPAGEKRCLANNWQSADFTNEIETHVARGGNAGLRPGGLGLGGLDIEPSGLGDNLAKIIEDRYPNAPVRTRAGSMSRLFLVRLAPDARRLEIPKAPEITHENPKGQKVFEVLTGGQIHIVGTRADCNDTRLEWSDIVSPDELPLLTADELEQLGEALLTETNRYCQFPVSLGRGNVARPSSTALVTVAPDHITEADADLLREVLAAIPRDAKFLDRDSRIHFMHAVWGATQGAAWGRELFLEWDEQYHPENGVGDPERAASSWDRVGHGGPVRAGAGLLRKLLEERGLFDLRDRFNRATTRAKFTEKIEAAKQTGSVPPPLMDTPLDDIPGGVYMPDDAMREIGARFSIVDFGGEACVVHRDRDGHDHVLSKGAFELLLANVLVEVRTRESTKLIAASTYWKRNPDRPPVRKAVFKTGTAPIAINEYNFWRGFAYRPTAGTDKIKTFLRHLWVVVCRKERKAFRYLIRWLAWVVQNPEKQAETVVVLRSELGGTGKTTVSQVMRKLFGDRHSAAISNAEHILGSHAGEALEHLCFVALEETLFSGNRAQSDRCKDLITGSSIFVNPKGRRGYSVPNRLSAMLTTNHMHSVDTGRDGRRWFVLDVDEAKAGNKSWFDRLYADLDGGGYAELLGFLQRLELKGWHPRAVEKTKALAKQQTMSATGVVAWLLDCASEGAIPVYNTSGSRSNMSPLDLGNPYSNVVLWESLAGFHKATRARWDIPNSDSFGGAMKKVLGEKRKRKHVDQPDGKRGRGYYIPQQDELRRALEDHLGMAAGTLSEISN